MNTNNENTLNRTNEWEQEALDNLMVFETNSFEANACGCGCSCIAITKEEKQINSDIK